MGGYPPRGPTLLTDMLGVRPMATGDRSSAPGPHRRGDPLITPLVFGGVRPASGPPRAGRPLHRLALSLGTRAARVPEPLRRPAEQGRVTRCPTGPFTPATCFASVLDRAGCARLMRRGAPLRLNMIFFWGVCCRHEEPRKDLRIG